MQVIEPRIDKGILVNPGIGFFAAPALEAADSPRLPEHKYRFTPDARAWNHPDSGVAFISSRWSALEPEEGTYQWETLDARLTEIASAKRMAVIRCAPYALGNDDIPAWLRARNPDKPDFPFWQIDPNNSDYAPCWARFVRALAGHLDGHPIIASIDTALVGAWGEGGGTEFLEPETMHLLADAYLDNFHRTPLQCMLHDPRSVAYMRAKGRPLGFRVDCLGDMGGFHGKKWSHMLDFYPQNIQNFGMDKAWERGPVVFEACWTMRDWYNNGWDISYIIDESLKWHISSFNSKGCPVPEEWQDEVGRWVGRMGYRLEPRRVIVPEEAKAGEPLRVRSLWVNTGTAPCYHPFSLCYRLMDRGGQAHHYFSPADIRTWLPGQDILLDDCVAVQGLPAGHYSLALGIETGITGFEPLALAAQGCSRGYLPCGQVEIKDTMR